MHGLNDTPGVWETAKKYFSHEHYAGEVKTFDYRDDTHDPLQANTNRLWKWLQKEGLTGKQVNFVGHSMGGLISRMVAHQHKQDLSVGSLVTLASPNHGSYLADWCPNIPAGYCNAAVQDMKTRSTTLHILNSGTENMGAYNENNTLTYAISQDEMVKADSVKLRGAGNRHISSSAEEYSESRGGSEVHTSIVRKKKVLADTLNFIRKANRERCSKEEEIFGTGGWTRSRLKFCLVDDGKNNLQASAKVLETRYFWGGAWYHPSGKWGYPLTLKADISKGGSHHVTLSGSSRPSANYDGAVTTNLYWPGSSGTTGTWTVKFTYTQVGPYWDTDAGMYPNPRTHTFTFG